MNGVSEIKLLNSVSLNMLSPEAKGFRIRYPLWIHPDKGAAYNPAGIRVVNLDPAQSYIGHQQLVDLINNRYESYLVCRRESVTLEPGEEVAVFQYRGPRLPEGAKELPEGAKIDVLLVEVL